MLHPSKKNNLSTQVFRQLQEDILTRQFQPGERLPSERELCDILGINRSSVREALKRLEQARLIEIRQGDGSIVLDFTLTAGFDLLSQMVMPGGRLNPLALRSVAELRAIMVTEVARLAALRVEEPELARLAALVEEIEACPATDMDAYQELDFEFHYTLARAGGNLGFVLIYNSIRETYRLLRSHFAPMFAHAMAHPGTHRRILEAVQRRDAEEAKTLCAHFVEQGNQELWKKYGETSLKLS